MNLRNLLAQIVLPYVQEIVPYPPGKPIEELEREWGITGTIKLASNENPLGPSPKAVEAMQKSLLQLHRYPDGSGYYLRQRLSEKTGVPFEGLVLGNGTNEILEMVVRAFMGAGDEAVISLPAFLMYSQLVQSVGGKINQVELNFMSLDLEAMAGAITPKTKIIFINNPNNPTGTAISKSEFDLFLKSVPTRVIIVLDEAYIEFVQDADTPQGIGYLEAHPNLVVLRTFSKLYGLAGIRIGYGMTHPRVASYMNRVRQPFNVNSLALTGALAALDDVEFIERTKCLVKEGLRYFYDQLDDLRLEYVKTQANFILVKVGQARKVYEDMLKLGVIIRCMDSYSLDEYVRINVGQPHENERCIESLRKVLVRG